MLLSFRKSTARNFCVLQRPYQSKLNVFAKGIICVGWLDVGLHATNITWPAFRGGVLRGVPQLSGSGSAKLCSQSVLSEGIVIKGLAVVIRVKIVPSRWG